MSAQIFFGRCASEKTTFYTKILQESFLGALRAPASKGWVYTDIAKSGWRGQSKGGFTYMGGIVYSELRCKVKVPGEGFKRIRRALRNNCSEGRQTQ